MIEGFLSHHRYFFMDLNLAHCFFGLACFQLCRALDVSSLTVFMDHEIVNFIIHATNMHMYKWLYLQVAGCDMCNSVGLNFVLDFLILVFLFWLLVGGGRDDNIITGLKCNPLVCSSILSFRCSIKFSEVSLSTIFFC